jgi:hypothetical protein
MMSNANDSFRDEALQLLRRFKSGELDDEKLEEVVQRLNTILPDPNYWDYTVDCIPELSPEEIVDRAFSYKPIQL